MRFLTAWKYFLLSLQFNGEPHSYTRFNLTQNMEGDNSQVEMKLSSDVDEEVGENGVGARHSHNSTRKPYVAQRFARTPKNLFFLGAIALLIFIIGKMETLNEATGSLLNL